MSNLHPQLAAVSREIEEATARARALAERLGDERFVAHPSQGGWSPAECVAHLSLTTNAFLPLIDDALAAAPKGAVDPGRHYGKGLLSGWFAWVLEPPYRIKAKTAPAFQPGPSLARGGVMADFERLQAELSARVAAANGYDLSAVTLPSPFSQRVRYNLIAAFSIITAHERRHLWQAEQQA